MPSFVSPAVDELMNAQVAALSVFDPKKNWQMRSPVAARIDWRLLIQTMQQAAQGLPVDYAQLTPPYIALSIGKHVPNPNWSVDSENYDLPFSTWLVDITDNYEDDETCLHNMEVQAESLRDYLMENLFQNFQIVDMPDVDASESNEANLAFLSGEYPAYAVCISGNLLVGTIVVQS